ncbi:MAG: hypothetical protein K5745_05940 [Saccharofermentans sp.]|nr:hypothetical protein [Saccharofermentans sp.]
MMNLEEYSELLMERDRLEKEAEYWNLEYVRAFGEYAEELLKLRMSCIRYKKLITYCQQRINFGLEPDSKEMATFIQIELAPFREQLKVLQQAKNIKSEPLSQYEVAEIKKIYRFIAKRLHPDINPQLFVHEEVKQIWNDTIKAYKANDFERMKELEVLAANVIAKYGDETIAVVIGDLDEKIEKVKKQCEEIKNTDPYMYRFLFDDPDAVKSKKDEYISSIEEYKVYEQDLKKIFESYDVDYDEDIFGLEGTDE